MARAYLGLGSNIDPARRIRTCLEALERRFGPLEVSPVYRCAAVGFEGGAFLNLAVGLDTDLAPGTLDAALKALEDEMGRDRSGPRFSDRIIDVDLLLYGELAGVVDGIELPRPEILEQPFVLGPLADLAPDYVHPHEARTLADLWLAMAARGHDLEAVEL